MTDRIKGFVVTLERDFRTDDVEAIATAIAMIKGVASVDPSVADVNDFIVRERMRRELFDQVVAVFKKAWEHTG